MKEHINQKYMDISLEAAERARLLLQVLTLEEKLAQLTCYFPQGTDYSALKNNYPHGVGQVSALEMRTLDTLEECARMQREVQEMVMRQSPHHIPAIFHMEGLCGAFIQGALSLPAGINRAASWDVELEEELGRIVSRQEKAVGITHIFAPVLDISRDSRMGRQGETYGEDPTLAAAMGTAFTRGIQAERQNGRKAEAVAKHFLGFHASHGGIHGADCEIGDRLLREIYGKPFQAAITEAGLRGIMPCYCSLNGEPVSVSKTILTGLLREEMGFDGLVVSDYCALGNVHLVQRVCRSLEEAGLRGLEAGMDMELHVVQCFNDRLKEWFAEGKADMAVLDRAVMRVLAAKFRMGLFENPFALAEEELKKEFFFSGDRAVTERSARESLVLLKNDGTLPLSKKIKRIALIGCHGETPRVMFGGYTHFSMAEGLYAAQASMAGVKGDNRQVSMKTYPGSKVQVDSVVPEALVHKIAPSAKSLLVQLQEEMPETEILYAYGYPYAGNDTSGYEEALAKAAEAELLLLTLGGKHGTSSIATMGEGVDAADINLPVCQEEFIKKAAALGKPMVGIHFNGRPVSSDAADRYLHALLEAFSPSEAGAEAIADVLTGVCNPCGKLPVSVAYEAGQIPVYYNHPNGSGWHQGDSVGFSEYVDLPHKPRYAFGHGLSYTSFLYENLRMDKKQVEPCGEIRISADITNDGGREGTEVVQLYLRDTFASVTRPNKELQGFTRVGLKPGQKKTVTFTVGASQLAFPDRDGRWKTEEGDVEVLLGSSSEDIRLTGSFCISGDGYPEGKNRGFYARVRIEQ